MQRITVLHACTRPKWFAISILNSYQPAYKRRLVRRKINILKTSDKTGTALITGGSSGIGYAIAKELAGKGCNLVLVSNQKEKLYEVCNELSVQHHVNAWPVFTDLAEPGAARKLYDWCLKENIEIDILVNNAGLFFFGEVVENLTEKARIMSMVHMVTPVELCILFGAEMKKRRLGHILNIASLAAFMQYPGISLYSASKGFLRSFSRSLRTEMLAYNVNVTCICPGAVSTNLFEMNDDERKKAMRWGIMMKPEKLAKLTVEAMFKRKAVLVPGFINRIFRAVVWLVPQWVIVLIRQHSKLLPPGK
jgi:short-subunit dehydrogenase